MTRIVSLFLFLPGWLSRLDTGLAMLIAFVQVTPSDTLDRLASLGVGGLLAGVTYYWKRADDAAHRAELKVIIEAQQKQNDRLLEYVGASTATSVELKKTLDALTTALRLEEKLSAIQLRLETSRDKK